MFVYGFYLTLCLIAVSAKNVTVCDVPLRPSSLNFLDPVTIKPIRMRVKTIVNRNSDTKKYIITTDIVCTTNRMRPWRNNGTTETQFPVQFPRYSCGTRSINKIAFQQQCRSSKFHCKMTKATCRTTKATCRPTKVTCWTTKATCRTIKANCRMTKVSCRTTKRKSPTSKADCQTTCKVWPPYVEDIDNNDESQIDDLHIHTCCTNEKKTKCTCTRKITRRILYTRSIS